MVWLPSLLGQCVKALLILMHPEHWSNQHGWIVWKQQRMKTRVEVHNHQHIYPQSHNSPKMVPNTLPQMEHEPQQPLKTSASSLTLQDWGKVHNLETAPSGGKDTVGLSSLSWQLSALPYEKRAGDSWYSAWLCGIGKWHKILKHAFQNGGINWCFHSMPWPIRAHPREKEWAALSTLHSSMESGKGRQS